MVPIPFSQGLLLLSIMVLSKPEAKATAKAKVKAKTSSSVLKRPAATLYGLAGGDDGSDQEVSVYMDKAKRKKLMDSWDEVPAAHQEMWQQAKSQKEKAKIVSALVKRTDGTLSLNLEHPNMVEKPVSYTHLTLPTKRIV